MPTSLGNWHFTELETDSIEADFEMTSDHTVLAFDSISFQQRTGQTAPSGSLTVIGGIVWISGRLTACICCAAYWFFCAKSKLKQTIWEPFRILIALYYFHLWNCQWFHVSVGTLNLEIANRVFEISIADSVGRSSPEIVEGTGTSHLEGSYFPDREAEESLLFQLWIQEFDHVDFCRKQYGVKKFEVSSMIRQVLSQLE